MRRLVFAVTVILLMGLLLHRALLSGRHQQTKPATPAAGSHPQVSAEATPSMPVSKHGYGKTIYAKTSDGTADGPTSVYEQDLDTGKTITLIPNRSLPKQFKRSMGVFRVSLDGNYFVVGHRDDNPELWSDLALWSRKTGKFHKLAWTKEDDSVSISAHGRYVALYSSFGHIRVYDSLTGSIRKMPSFQTVTYGDEVVVAWSADEQNMIVANSPNTGGSTVYLLPMTSSGKRVLLRWPRAIDSITGSPKGRQFAFADSKGVYVVSQHGKHTRELPIHVEPIGDSSPFYEVAYDRSGSTLAVLSSLSYGEPSVQLNQQLWHVSVTRGGVHKVAEWDESYLDVTSDDGTRADESIAGWASDSGSILTIAEIASGHGGDIQAIRNDFYLVLACDIKGGKQAELCRPGDGCLGMTWWPGK